MKIHDRFESLADLYGAGGLDEKERQEMNDHAAACVPCAGLLREAREFASWARGAIAPDAPPADLEDRVVARLGWTATAARPRTRSSFRMMGGLAAAVVLVIIGAVFSEKGGSKHKYLWELQGNLVAYGGAADVKKEIERSAHAGREKERKLGSTTRGVLTGSTFTLDGVSEAVEPPAPSASAPAVSPPPPEEKPEPKQEEGRKIIRNAELRLEVDSYDAAYAKIGEIATAAKGFIAGVDTERLANGKHRATVTVRLHPDHFEASLAKFRELGLVRNQSLTAQDITKAYVDLEARLVSKQTLVERLKKVLLEGKGTVKELMEVEVQMGKTLEEIDAAKGELKYYDNQVGLTTVVLRLSEKDLGQPFEYVQTLQANLGLIAQDPVDVYAKAQKEIADAGGKVVDSKLTRQSDGSAQGFVKGRIDAAKFPAAREALKKLGHVDKDTVNQQQTARGGETAGSKPDAPVKKEEAVIDVAISSPEIFVTKKAQIAIETSGVENAYQAARRAVEKAGGGIIDGSLADQGERGQASVRAQVDADTFGALVAELKALGKGKGATVNQMLPPSPASGKAPLLRERAEIDLSIAAPSGLIDEEHGFGRMVRDTFSKSVSGLLWSIKSLFVGIALAGPWLALLVAAIFVYRRIRRKGVKSTSTSIS